MLIFDEPTSALVAETENILRENIKSLSPGRTIFMISHSYSAIGIAGRTLILDKGTIAENGSKS